MEKTVSATVLFEANRMLLTLFVVFTTAAQTTQYQYLERKRTENSTYMCQTGEQALILEAFYTAVNDVSVCSERCIDRNAAGGERLGRCLLVASTSGIRCHQRMSVEDLNAVYHGICGVGNSKCDLRPTVTSTDPFPLSVKSWSTITYTCIPERETIDPCDEVLFVLKTQRLIMVNTETLQSGKKCHNECYLMFTEHPVGKRFYYSFLTQDTDKSQKNTVRYTTINADPEVSTNKDWTEMKSGYDNPISGFSAQTKGIHLQFDISSMARMSRLWLSLNGTQFNMSCAPFLKAGETREGTNARTTSATSAAETTTTSGKHADEPTEPTEVDNTTLVVAVVSVSVIGFLVFAVVILFICRKRMHRKKSSQRATNTNYMPALSNTYEPPPVPLDERIYAECNPDGLYAVNARREPETRPTTGSDVSDGGYSHLSSPPVMDIDREPSLNYHHVVPVASADVYHSLQREPKRRKVVDNVYSICA